MTAVYRFSGLPIRTFAAMAFTVTTLCGAQAQEIRVTHGQGEAVLPATPRTVVVFDLASLDTLQALGIEVAGVPGARFPDYLSDYGDDRYPKVGTLFEPDYDALAALEPDLIVIGGRSRNAYEELSALAPTVDLSTGTDDFVGSVIRNTRKLGEIFAVEDEAQELIAVLEATLADLHAKAADAGTGLVIFGVNENISGHAPGTRFGIVHDVIGIPSVMPAADPAAAASPRPAADSPEAQALRDRTQAEFAQALAADPDWLFVLDRGAAFGEPGAVADTLAARPDVTATTAWKSEQVVHLDAPTWYLVGGGVTALQNTAAQVSAAFDAAN